MEIKSADEILKKHIGETMSHKGILDAMKEYAKKFIDLAADKAFINVTHGHDDWEDLNNAVSEGKIKVDKESILSLKQLIK